MKIIYKPITEHYGNNKYPYEAFVTHDNNGACLTIYETLGIGQMVKTQNYKSRKGAMIALGKFCEGFSLIWMY